MAFDCCNVRPNGEITMKKILFVHHCSNIGGGSYCLLNIIRTLDQSDLVPIVLLKKRGPLSEEFSKLGIKVLFLRDITVVPYNKSIFRINSIITYFVLGMSFLPFKKIINMINPDIVYLNSVMLYPYLRMVKRCGKKSIIHIREHWPLDEHIHQLRHLQSTVGKYADRIIAINRYSASLVKNTEKKTYIVYDWVDFSNRYIEHDLNEIFGEDVSNKRVFLYAGGVSVLKGVLEVFQAFNHIDGDEYRLLALGVDKDAIVSGIRGKIKYLLSKVGWNSYSMRVFNILESDKRIVTYPPIYEIKDIIEKSYCILSYFTIPHSNLLLAEGIILGTPVVAARTSESIEYSENGKYSILYELKNYHDFQEKITFFIQNDAVCKNNLARGASIAAERFNPQKNISRLLNVIDNS